MIFPAEFESSPPCPGVWVQYIISGVKQKTPKEGMGAKRMAKTAAKTMGQTKFKYNIVVNAG